MSGKFTVKMNNGLSYENIQTIALVYQPIMGMKAYSLYMTFYSLVMLNSDTSTTHDELYKMLSLNEGEFLEIREKLEALKLIDTFMNNEGEYIYLVKTPETAKKILTEGSYGLHLLNQLGEDGVNRLLTIFDINDRINPEFKRISKNFLEVFATKPKQQQKPKVETKEVIVPKIEEKIAPRIREEKVIEQSVTVSTNGEFDFGLFAKMLKDEKVIKVFSSKEKQQIERLAIEYALNENELSKLYKETIDDAYNLDMRELNRKIKALSNVRSVKLVEDEKILDVKTNDKLDRFDMIAQEIDNQSPIDILLKYGDIVSKSDEVLIENLVEKTKFPIGVINVLLMFVLSLKDGKMQAYAYFETIASEWSRAKVKTTKDALKYLEDYQNQKAKIEEAATVVKTPRREKQVIKNKVGDVSWLEEYKNDFFGE